MVTEFKSILDLVRTFPTEGDCIAHLEKLMWNGTPVSPFDNTSKVYKCAGGKYKCKNTGKYFNVKVGTIFEDTKIPMIKWFMALYLFSSHKKGISSHQLAKDIDVTQKTAWFMLHRLRYAFVHPNFHKAVDGVVEVDETYIGGSAKNRAGSDTQGTQGRSLKTKKPVLGIIERGGILMAQVVPNTKKATVEPIIKNLVKGGSTVNTDEWSAYRGLNRYYNHSRVIHGAKEYVNGMAHTNTIEGFWSHLKRGIDGIYHWVSKQHLQGYVNEYTLRYNTRELCASSRFNLVLQNTSGRLTYYNLIKSGR